MSGNQGKIRVELIETTYGISDGIRTIYAVVDGRYDKLTLLTARKEQEFVFRQSDPEIARAVVGLMSEAVKLVEKPPLNTPKTPSKRGAKAGEKDDAGE